MISKFRKRITASAGTGMPVTTGYTSAIPFTGRAAMPRQQVVGAITFTKVTSGAVVGASVDLELVADGTNVPSFSAFKEWGGSAGYLNTTGMVNICRFEFTGLDYIFSVNQLVSPVAAPRLTSASAFTTQNTITLTYDQSLNTGSTPAASCFTISNTGGAQTVSSVSVTGSTVVLTTSRTNLITDTITVSYTPPLANGTLSSTGEFAGGVSAYSVTVVSASPPSNTVAPALSSTVVPTGVPISVTTGTWSNSPTSYTYQWIWADTSANISGATSSSYTPVSGDVGHTLKCAVTATNAYGSTTANSNTSGTVTAQLNVRFTTKGANVVESGSGPWSYTGTGVSGFASGTSTNQNAVTAVKIPSGQDGFFGFTVGNITDTNGAIVGVSTGSTNDPWNTFAAALYWDTAVSGRFESITGGTAAGTVDTNIAPSAGMLVRFRRSGTSLIGEVSTNSGSTWSTTKTWTGVTGDLYMHLSVGSNTAGTTGSVFGSGNVV